MSSKPMGPSTIKVDIRSFTRSSLGLIAVFVAASLFVKYQQLVLGHRRLFGLVHLFDLDGEQNLPTFYQSMTLMLASIMAWAIAADQRAAGGRSVKRWIGLAAVFAAMGADEFVSLHELITNEVLLPYWHSRAIGATLSWACLAFPLITIFGLVYTRFILAMPVRQRNGFISAGALYLSGVILLETIGNQYSLGHGQQNMIFAVSTTIEETFEMLGVLMLNRTLLEYIAHAGKNQHLLLKVTHD